MALAADIRDAALQLAEQERLELATELLESVEGPPDPEWERAWIEEIDRRVAAADATGRTGSLSGFGRNSPVATPRVRSQRSRPSVQAEGGRRCSDAAGGDMSRAWHSTMWRSA